MEIIELNNTTHVFDKLNLITLFDKKGSYDNLKCKNCGLEGKSRMLGTIEVRKNKPCKLNELRKGSVKILMDLPLGAKGANLLIGTIHELVEPPKDRKDRTEIWVKGVGTNVRLLPREFEFV